MLSTQWNPLNEVYLLSKFDDSSFSMTWDIYTFSNWSSLGKSKWCLLVHFYLLWAGQLFSVILLTLGKALGAKNNPSHFWQKIQELRIGSGTSLSIIQSAGIKNWVPHLINRLQRFNILFLSITGFSDLCDKVTYAL